MIYTFKEKSPAVSLLRYKRPIAAQILPLLLSRSHILSRKHKHKRTHTFPGCLDNRTKRVI